MMPIQELLNRIRWDQEFGKGDFALGYYDRLEDRIIIVPFREVEFPKGQRFLFQVVDEEGRILTIPYHRIREVYKDGRLIWQRPA